MVFKTTVFPPAFGPVIKTTLSFESSKFNGTVFCLPIFLRSIGCLASEMKRFLSLSICGNDPIISIEYFALAKTESI